jgi:hypothetical protein
VKINKPISKPKPTSRSAQTTMPRPRSSSKPKPTPRSAQTHAQAEIVEQTKAHAETVNHYSTTKSTEEKGELWKTENRGESTEKEKKWKREKEIVQNEKKKKKKLK